MIDPKRFLAVPEESLGSLHRSHADIVAGGLRDAEEVDREIQERVENMRAYMTKVQVE